ncbi:hypothetical protein KEM56_002586, partial [Ascosphaera pollenicola]
MFTANTGNSRPKSNKGIKLKRGSEFSDLTIQCQGQTFPAHKIILCSQSDVINAALQGNRFKESDTSIFNLDKFEPKIVDGALDFLYTAEFPEYHDHDGDYTMSATNDAFTIFQEDMLARHHKEAMFYVEIARFADFLNIPKLLEEAKERVRRRAHPTLDPGRFLALIRCLDGAGLLGKFEIALYSKLPESTSELLHLLKHDYYDALNLPHTFRVELIQRLISKASTYEAESHRVKHESQRFLQGTLDLIRPRILCPICNRTSASVREGLLEDIRKLKLTGAFWAANNTQMAPRLSLDPESRWTAPLPSHNLQHHQQPPNSSLMPPPLSHFGLQSVPPSRYVTPSLQQSQQSRAVPGPNQAYEDKSDLSSPSEEVSGGCPIRQGPRRGLVTGVSGITPSMRFRVRGAFCSTHHSLRQLIVNDWSLAMSAPAPTTTAERTVKRRKLEVAREMPFADLVIESQGQQFSVHKLVVCQYSPVINAAVKDGRFQEGSNGIFKLDDFEPEVVEDLLEVVYSADYPNSLKDITLQENETEEAYLKRRREDIRFHLKVACLADYLGMSGICTSAQKSITRRMNPYRNGGGLLSYLVQNLIEMDVYEKFSPLTWKNLERSDLSMFIHHDDYAILDISKPLRNDILETLETSIQATERKAECMVEKWFRHQM